MGDNGSGKSTIFKLLCTLYRPDEGNILIDEQDLFNIKKSSIVRNISIIFADPFIFDGSIYENIQIGKMDSKKEDIIRATKKVNLHEFIDDLNDKYDTYVGENGILLSSGEKQKIALARAILKNSPIILLDESYQIY